MQPEHPLRRVVLAFSQSGCGGGGSANPPPNAVARTAVIKCVAGVSHAETAGVLMGLIARNNSP